VNFVFARGKAAWIATDRGVSVTDGDTWVNYRGTKKEGCLIEITRPGAPVSARTIPTKLPNDFVLGVWADDDQAWFATSDGLGHGYFAPSGKSHATATSRN